MAEREMRETASQEAMGSVKDEALFLIERYNYVPET